MPDDFPVPEDLVELDGRSGLGLGFTLGHGCKVGGEDVEAVRVWSKSAFKEEIWSSILESRAIIWSIAWVLDWL